MIRTQIQLEETDFERLKAEAARRGCSVAALVRESVITALEVSERKAANSAVMELAGKYRSGLKDLSQNHDTYLEDGW
jgi:predicted DNA-binding ribbon-helix-helix protein